MRKKKHMRNYNRKWDDEILGGSKAFTQGDNHAGKRSCLVTNTYVNIKCKIKPKLKGGRGKTHVQNRNTFHAKVD